MWMTECQTSRRRQAAGRVASAMLITLLASGCMMTGLPGAASGICAPASLEAVTGACDVSGGDAPPVVTGSLPDAARRIAPRLTVMSADPGPRDAEPASIPEDDGLPPDAPAPRSERQAVVAEIADTSTGRLAEMAAKAMPPAPAGAPDAEGAAAPAAKAVTPAGGKPGPGSRASAGLSMSEAVAVAVLSHPLMGAQAARVKSSGADLRYAQGAIKPTLEVFAGTGQSTAGSYGNYPTQFDHLRIPGTARTDAGFTFRQLIYDFGAARAEIARNRALIDAEKLKLADQAEDIALRTVNAFLNLLEQKELIGLIDQTVSQQRALADLIRLSQQNGNGTKADLDRVQAKVIETEALRIDVKTAYQTALDEFHRLTNLGPQQVRRPKAVPNRVPGTIEQAIAIARSRNPALLALDANGVAFNHQIDGLKAQGLPRIEFQSDGLNKHYIGGKRDSQGALDMRAMVSLSFKLLDGGMLEAQADRIRFNQQSNTFKALDERETVVLNLRRFYLTIASSRTKRDAAMQGITTAASVNKLYLEQFKAGKRTIFEVLDSNMLMFTMHRNRVSGEFEEMRAQYGILRNLGALCETIAKG
jgi:outer membrane protein, adhesin transport system